MFRRQGKHNRGGADRSIDREPIGAPVNGLDDLKGKHGRIGSAIHIETRGLSGLPNSLLLIDWQKARTTDNGTVSIPRLSTGPDSVHGVSQYFTLVGSTRSPFVTEEQLPEPGVIDEELIIPGEIYRGRPLLVWRTLDYPGISPESAEQGSATLLIPEFESFIPLDAHQQG